MAKLEILLEKRSKSFFSEYQEKTIQIGKNSKIIELMTDQVNRVAANSEQYDHRIELL